MVGSTGKDGKVRARRTPAYAEVVLDDVPGRFAMSSNGPGMRVRDSETGRTASFSKTGTSDVAKVLAQLFGDPDAAPCPGPAEGLPPVCEVEGLVLRLGKVALDPFHRKVVLGPPRKHPGGLVVHAYRITRKIGSGERTVGYLVLQPGGRLLLSMPAVMSAPTTHTGLGPALDRVASLSRALPTTV